MAEGVIGNEMVATYTVSIEGIERTRSELARLTGAIKELRVGNYSPTASATALASSGSSDIFVSKMDSLEGRVQTAAQKIMLRAMDLGKETQAQVLRAETTAKGLSGKPAGRNSAGRDVTGTMIDALTRNVEVFKTTDRTLITGFHGWGTQGRQYFSYQEKGTLGRRASLKRAAGARKRHSSASGVPAANSLGQTILPVREYLKRELAGLKK